MNIKRIFFGREVPLLRHAAIFLVERYLTNESVDLSQALVVVPGRRAGRRLVELLVEIAEEGGHVLQLPKVITVGALPECLTVAGVPYANDLERTVAWLSALQQISGDQLQVLVSTAPSKDDITAWIDLAGRVDALYVELSAAASCFLGVSRQVELDLGEESAWRWVVLDRIKDIFLDRLSSLGLSDQYDSRRRLLELRQVSAAGEIFLLGMADLNEVSRQFLKQVDNYQVTALISAPEEEKEYFDEYGCLIVEKWLYRHIPVNDQQLIWADRPMDQAEIVLDCLKQFASDYSYQQVVVGLADPKLAPFISEILSINGVASHSAVGTLISATAPYLLLKALSNYLSSHAFVDLATLLRHPDFAGSVLSGVGRQMTERDLNILLDNFHTKRLPSILSLSTSEWSSGSAADQAGLGRVLEEVAKLLQDLVVSERLSISDWGLRLADLFSAVYSNFELSRYEPGDQLLLDAFDVISKQLRGMAESQCYMPITASGAISLLLRQLSSVNLPDESQAGSVELLGWLELALDDSEAVIITGMNEGFVPQALNADPFLPDGLRKKLGLLDNRQRYARDAYALTLILAAKEEVRLVVGKQGLDKEPLLPSRLLLTGDPHLIATRLDQFFSVRSSVPRKGAAGAPIIEVKVPPEPRRLDVTKIRYISVSSLRDYLECPYLHYLRNVLKLNRLDDSARELDALQFGTLTHSILKDFADGDVRTSLDSEEIQRFLWHLLESQVRERYGRHPLPAVQLQIYQLRQRLAGFAQQQMRWREKGWSIADTEFSVERRVLVDSQGAQVILQGRIDRLDRHDRTGAWMVFDYKTGDNVRKPGGQKRKITVWKDLQLPAYRYLLSDKEGFEISKLDLGYFVLGSGRSQSGPLLMGWSAEQFSQAEDEIRRVCGAIAAESFKWRDACSGSCREFAALCGVNQLLAEEEDGEDAEG